MFVRAFLAVLLFLPGCADGDPAARPNPAGADTATPPGEIVHRAGDPVDVSAAAGRLSLRFTAPLGRITAARVLSEGDTVAMHRQLVTGGSEVWRASLPLGVSRYLLEAEGPGRIRRLGPFTPPAEPFRSVPWVAGSVAYQIFPERFANGDVGNDPLTLATDESVYWAPERGGPTPRLSPWDGAPAGDDLCCHQYFGGDLQGVLDRLGHLEALGVTAIYLNPIFLSGSAHGYDTWDYLRVAPNLGDTVVLAALLDEAHARGIRLIWDFVPNHVGVGHQAFRDAVSRGESSEYWDWFSFRVPADSVRVGNGAHYAAWWDYGSLPELRTNHPEVLAHLLEVAIRWTNFGFDGIRVDVAGDLDNPEEFFPALRAAVKQLDAEVYLLGEIWERDPGWVRGDKFDALMNYPVGEGIVEPFARGTLTGPEAAEALATHVAVYPEASTAMGFNLVSSHDTDRLLVKMGARVNGPPPGPEVLARHGLASALLFALPGMPVTFQGDECGSMGGGHHLLTRYPIQWDACDPDAVAHYATLAALKRETPALASPTYRWYPSHGGVLAFLRGEPGEDEVLAVFNNGTGPGSLALPDGPWADLVTGEEFSGTVELGGLGWRFLVGR